MAKKIALTKMSANQIESALRLGAPSVITRIKEGMVLFDPRTLNNGEIESIVEAAKRVFQEPGSGSQ